MKLLLDTQIFLWYIRGDAKLPTAVRDHIRDQDTQVYLSVASIWEALVKYQLGKLPLPHPAGHYLRQQREQHNIESLRLDEASVARLETLPLLHRDPFDRMLICQALEHQLVIATVDKAILAYQIPVL